MYSSFAGEEVGIVGAQILALIGAGDLAHGPVIGLGARLIGGGLIVVVHILLGRCRFQVAGDAAGDDLIRM